MHSCACVGRPPQALSALGSVAVGADKALGEMRRAADEAHDNARRLRAQAEVRAIGHGLAMACHWRCF